MFFCFCDFIFDFFAIFSKMRPSISTLSVILSFMKICVARTFLVERHLDVVLEVLQVVQGSKFLFYKICWDLPLEDSLKKLRWLLQKMREIFKFLNFGKKKKKKKKKKKNEI